MAKLWNHYGFDLCDKEVEIRGPDDVRLMLDFDDVNHAKVERVAKKMIALLNKHWNSKEKPRG